MRRYMVEVPVVFLQKGDKVFDFQRKAYDIVSYIEREADNVFVAYSSVGNAPGEWKEYADNFSIQSKLLVLVDLPLLKESLIPVCSKYVEAGDKVYDPQSRKIVEVLGVLPSNKNQISIDIRKETGELTTVSLPSVVYLIRDMESILQDTNNFG